MSRQIKFRAWIKNEHFMEHCIAINPFYIGDCDRRRWTFSEVELMQFTGLCDRNNTEIYEGDVLVDEYGFVHVVQYFQPDCRYITVVIEAFKSGNWDDSHEYEDLVWVECKVIGNIYENPELLKGDSKDEPS